MFTIRELLQARFFNHYDNGNHGSVNDYLDNHLIDHYDNRAR